MSARGVAGVIARGLGAWGVGVVVGLLPDGEGGVEGVGVREAGVGVAREGAGEEGGEGGVDAVGVGGVQVGGGGGEDAGEGLELGASLEGAGAGEQVMQVSISYETKWAPEPRVHK